jgi:uncharacterized Zn finger protein (UPF0148 family)
MNVNDGSVVCPTCKSGTLGYSAMKHAQRAERTEAATVAAIAGWLRRQKPQVELEPADSRSTLAHAVYLDVSRLFAMAADAIERGEYQPPQATSTDEPASNG